MNDDEFTGAFGKTVAARFRGPDYLSDEQPLIWRSSKGMQDPLALADRDGKVLVIVRRSVLNSDRAITAVFNHEAVEIDRIRRMIQSPKQFGLSDGFKVKHFKAEVTTGIAGNSHWKANEESDNLVNEMVAAGK